MKELNDGKANERCLDRCFDEKAEKWAGKHPTQNQNIYWNV